MCQPNTQDEVLLRIRPLENDRHAQLNLKMRQVSNIRIALNRHIVETLLLK